MKQIISPIGRENHGPELENLHATLKLLLDRGKYDVNEDKRLQLQSGLQGECAESHCGPFTAELLARSKGGLETNGGLDGRNVLLRN